MRLLVVNCNTSKSMTAAIVAVAREACREDTEIIGIEPSWGVAAAEGFYDSFISAAAVLHLLSTRADAGDAVVMAGFGEHGRHGARQLLDVPVVDITEASAQIACLLGYRFGVVTSVEAAIAPIEESLLLAGLGTRCVGIRATGIGVLDLDSDVDVTVEAMIREGQALVNSGADALVLGCAGMGGLDTKVEEAIGIPVVDGVSAAVRLAEVLVYARKKTSKRGPYAPSATAIQATSWPDGLRGAVPAPLALDGHPSARQVWHGEAEA